MYKSILDPWGHVKKIAFLVGHFAKALTPPPLPVSGKKSILCKFFFTYIHIYVFETSKLRLGKWLFKKTKMSLTKIHKQWKLLERHKNNTSIGVDYLT